MGGWVKLHRDITKNKVFQNPFLLKLFVYFLCKAGHEEHDWKDSKHFETVHLKAGEFITSFNHIAESIGTSRDCAYRWTKQLEKDGCIIAKCNSQYTKISIVNWALYQGDDEQNQTPIKHQSNTNTTRAQRKSNTSATNQEINKNYKNEKERKEREISPFGEGDFG